MMRAMTVLTTPTQYDAVASCFPMFSSLARHVEFLGENRIVSYFSRLLLSGRLADDLEGFLAAVQRQAFVSIESGGNFDRGFRRNRQVRYELSLASFADAKQGWPGPHYAESSLRHNSSLPPLIVPVDFKRRHCQSPKPFKP